MEDYISRIVSLDEKYDTSFMSDHDDYESESEDEVPLNWRLSSDIISTMRHESDDESEEATFED